MAERDEHLPLRRTWPRMARVAAANDRLVANQILRVALAWALWAIPVAVAGVGGFSAYAQSAARRESDLIDLLGGSRHGVAAAAVVAYVLAVVVESWLIAAFCASVRDGRARLSGGVGTTARILAVNGTAYAVVIAATAASAGAGLLLLIALNIGTLYAPYAIALRGDGVVASLRTNARLVRRAPGTMAFLTAGFLLVADIGYALLDQPIIDGTDVLPVMVLASILFDALLAYAVDCAAIGVLAEADEPPPRAP